MKTSKKNLRRRSRQAKDTTISLSPARLQSMNRAFSVISQALPAPHNYVPDNQVFRYSSSTTISPAFTTSTTLPTLVAFNFQFGDLGDSGNLSTVFDQYRIDVIECWVLPQTSSQTDNTTSNHGLLASVIDYDDSTALSSFDAANQYSNCITACGISGHYRIFRPHAALAAYSGAFTSYANWEEMWIDMNSQTVQHYGLKIASTVTGSAYSWNMIVKYHCSLRNLR
jgi:hypothetical protein